MARKKTSSRGRKEINYSENFILARPYLGKIILTGILFFGVIAGLFFGIRHFFYNNDIFRIKEVYVSVKSGNSFDEDLNKLNELYAGRNIFTIDLKQVQVLIKKNFPQFKEIEVRRNFPNVLEFDIVPREAIAIIDSGGGVVVDSEGIILALGDNTEELVMIKGINFFLRSPRKGDRIENGALSRALLLLRGLSKKGDIDKNHIDYVDIRDRNNMLLSISGVIVKVGKDNFSRKINSLTEILSDPELNIEDLKYIDLRFEDAVLSFR